MHDSKYKNKPIDVPQEYLYLGSKQITAINWSFYKNGRISNIKATCIKSVANQKV